MDFRPAMQATTGIGRYVHGLAGALADRCDLRLYGCYFSGNRPEARRGAPAPLTAFKIPSRLVKLLARTRIYPIERLLGGFQVFHNTNFLMLPVRTPQVMTLHDLAFFQEGLHTARATTAMRQVVDDAVQRCGAFCVPSEATARDCEERLGLSRDRLFVTPLGVDESFFLAPTKCSVAPTEGSVAPTEGEYVLGVGTLEPRKNQLRLVQAMAGIDAELLLAGRRGWSCDDVVEAAEKAPNVRWLGHVPEARLRELVAGASVVAYPSLFEGFGLPVLEAMAAGKPVLTSDRDPMREVAGDAALLVDPCDVGAIADGLSRLLGDPALRERLAKVGPERARRFTWDACAEATLRAYHAVLA